VYVVSIATALAARSRAATVVLVILSRASPGTMAIVSRGPIAPTKVGGGRTCPIVVCVRWAWSHQDMGAVTVFAVVVS